MTTKPMSYYLAPVMLVLNIVLAAANWYFQPARIGGWLSALVFLAIAALILFFSSRRSGDAAWQRGVDEIRNAIVFAGLIMMIPLSAKLAAILGLISDADFSKRVMNAVIGVFFVFTGNAIPKTLTPLSSLQCDPAKVQAFQRLTGWTWVLMGLAYAMAWLVLPLDLANPVSMALILCGMVVVLTQIFRFRRSRRKEA
jgi:hypothetical protein